MPEEQYMLRQSYRGSSYAKSSWRGWTSPLLHLTHKICCGKNYYYKFSQPTCDFLPQLDTFNLLVIQLQTQQSGCLVCTRHHDTVDTCSSHHSLHSPLENQNCVREKIGHHPQDTAKSAMWHCKYWHCFSSVPMWCWAMAMAYWNVRVLAVMEKGCLSCCGAVMVVGDLSTEVNGHQSMVASNLLMWLTLYLPKSHGEGML